MDPLDTVKIIVQKACAQIDMKERYQFFSLYEVAQQEGVVKHEAFAKDNHKIMDVYNSHKNAKELALKQQKKKIQFKIYLRIRIYYKLFREDVDSISMFYMQNVFEVSQGRLPLTYEEQISLAAHYCYSITHAPESGHKYMEEVVQQTAPKSSQINVEKWISDVRQAYQKLAYTNVIEARWMYLEILRPLDLFLSYQFKCRMFEQEKTEQGYRSKLTQDVVLGIRPLQIIISDLQLKTIYIIDFSEMTKWGQSLSNKSYFLIQHENNNLFVFEIQDTELSDYLINAYVNWKLERNIDDDSNPTYNDVVTFVINPEDDKKNRIQ